MKLLPEASRQALTIALRELERDGILERKVIAQKPLNVQYTLTDLGNEFLPIFSAIEDLGLLPVRNS